MLPLVSLKSKLAAEICALDNKDNRNLSSVAGNLYKVVYQINATQIDGILQKGPYPSCLRMAGPFGRIPSKCVPFFFSATVQLDSCAVGCMLYIFSEKDCSITGPFCSLSAMHPRNSSLPLRAHLMHVVHVAYASIEYLLSQFP